MTLYHNFVYECLPVRTYDIVHFIYVRYLLLLSRVGIRFLAARSNGGNVL
jgi:hypothetical protein